MSEGRGEFGGGHGGEIRRDSRYINSKVGESDYENTFWIRFIWLSSSRFLVPSQAGRDYG